MVPSLDCRLMYISSTLSKSWQYCSLLGISSVIYDSLHVLPISMKFVEFISENNWGYFENIDWILVSVTVSPRSAIFWLYNARIQLQLFWRPGHFLKMSGLYPPEHLYYSFLISVMNGAFQSSLSSFRFTKFLYCSSNYWCRSWLVLNASATIEKLKFSNCFQFVIVLVSQFHQCSSLPKSSWIHTPRPSYSPSSRSSFSTYAFQPSTMPNKYTSQ